MRAGFYPHLAANGIKKNKKLYVPYMLTCAGMIMMNYIISFLATSEQIANMGGGGTAQLMLAMGVWIIGVFSVIFLFYTNSFLMRRRKKELGLYNILGMNKKNIGRILLWETLMIAAISITTGLLGGIAFSKMAELGLVNMLGAKAGYSFSVSFDSIMKTVVLYVVIFVLIFINELRQVHTANPAALINSGNMGEKPPKANWLLGILGFVMLAFAYYMAVSINNPVSALVWFFVAVAMVIVATNLIFISGSVVMCRILQKNKGYYYKANHFVSVSSMAYRMKRNGAGLASICILVTMVLVMITGSASLYFGAEESLSERYPNDIGVYTTFTGDGMGSEESKGEVRNVVENVLGKYDVEGKHVRDYTEASIQGILKDGEFSINTNEFAASNITDDMRIGYFISDDDYEKLTGNEADLKAGEVMIYDGGHNGKKPYGYDDLAIAGGETYKVVKKLNKFPLSGDVAANIVPALVVVTEDIQELTSPFKDLTYKDFKLLNIHWYYGVDMEASAEKKTDISEEVNDMIDSLHSESENKFARMEVESLELNRAGFYALYGGLLFLGIMLSIVFLFATTLIIYYKQISEGYEDQSRFEIMQKVGMTKKDIKKSIHSQMLTVFLMPLAVAVIHLGFAFPMIKNMIMLFAINNIKLLIITAAVSVLIFAVFYVIVYRITSNAYYNIVSGAKEKIR